MKVGIVGCGHICEQHLRALRRIRDVNVVGVCDRHRDRAVSVAEVYQGARVFDNIDRMIDEAPLDVIHILTPPQSHREVAVRALEAGCHVLVEKPMAMNADEARDMLEVSRRRGRTLGVCHNFRFIPALIEANELINRGALGRILSADIFWSMSSYSASLRGEAIKWMRNLPGGPFQEVLPHLIYVLAALMGNLKLASVMTTGGHGDKEETELRALFASGRGPVTLALSLEARPVQKFVMIYGTDMSLHIDLATNMLLRLRAPTDGIVGRALVNVDQSVQMASQTLVNAVKTLTGRLSRGHETLIECFYAALRRGETPPAGGEEGLATVVVLDDLWKALGRDLKRHA